MAPGCRVRSGQTESLTKKAHVVNWDAARAEHQLAIGDAVNDRVVAEAEGERSGPWRFDLPRIIEDLSLGKNETGQAEAFGKGH